MKNPFRLKCNLTFDFSLMHTYLVSAFCHLKQGASLYRKAGEFSLSIRNSNGRRWKHLVGSSSRSRKACLDSNILELVARLVAKWQINSWISAWMEIVYIFSPFFVFPKKKKITFQNARRFNSFAADFFMTLLLASADIFPRNVNNRGKQSYSL